MKKFRFFILILALCLWFPACATVEDLPPDMIVTPPDKEEIPTTDTGEQVQKGEYRKLLTTSSIGASRKVVYWNNLVFTSKAEIINLENGRVLSACSDPLCDHQKDSCANRVLQAAKAIQASHASPRDELVLYVMRQMLVSVIDNQTPVFSNKILRYHFNTGEMTVLVEDLPGGGSSFYLDPVTDNIFFYQSLLNDAGETETYLYILNGLTGKMDIVPMIDVAFTVKYVIGDVVYGTNAQSGQHYCIDLSQKKLVIEEAEANENLESSEYRYYRENEVEERVYIPDELIELYEELGGKPYRDFTKYDLYRVNLKQENATPELVAKDIAYHKVEGDYVIYHEFAPQHVTSYLVAYYQDENGVRHYSSYDLDDPDAPQGAIAASRFNEYYGPIHVLDATTLQELSVIESGEWWIDPGKLFVMAEGIFVTWQSRDPEIYRLNTVDRYSYQEIFGYLYLNRSRLTDADTVVVDTLFY